MTELTNETTETKNTPDYKLVQEKAYLKMGPNGSLIRKSTTIDITVGWNQTSKDGMPYISWADSVVPVEPDIDGRIKLVTFPIKNEE